jgi:hypothetical protein
MSAESGFLRHGPYDIRGYVGGDLKLDIKPDSIWVDGHVSTITPTATEHATTKGYVDGLVGTAYWATLPIEISTGHHITIRNAEVYTGGIVSAEAQEFGGVKTFHVSPLVPTPTTDMQASTKKYVDDTVSGSTAGWSTGTANLVFTTGSTVDKTVAIKWIKNASWVTAQIAGIAWTGTTGVPLICVEGWPAAIRPVEKVIVPFAGLNTTTTAALMLDVLIDTSGNVSISPGSGAGTSSVDPIVPFDGATDSYKCFSGSVSFSIA